MRRSILLLPAAAAVVVPVAFGLNAGATITPSSPSVTRSASAETPGPSEHATATPSVLADDHGGLRSVTRTVSGVDDSTHQAVSHSAVSHEAADHESASHESASHESASHEGAHHEAAHHEGSGHHGSDDSRRGSSHS